MTTQKRCDLETRTRGYDLFYTTVVLVFSCSVGPFFINVRTEKSSRGSTPLAALWTTNSLIWFQKVPDTPPEVEETPTPTEQVVPVEAKAASSPPTQGTALVEVVKVGGGKGVKFYGGGGSRCSGPLRRSRAVPGDVMEYDQS